MSVIPKKPRQIELPKKYPRPKEILIFSDIGDLDHVFDGIDDLEKTLLSLPPECSRRQWQDSFRFSPMHHIQVELRKACIEFERFSQPDDWCPEDDVEFMECMNDWRELWWLVNDLENGRVGESNGMPVVMKEEAYYAAAHSLEIAMYFEEIPGEEGWGDHCVNRLKYYLTRYHAAALEIVMHRSDAYLNKNVRNIKTGSAIRKASQTRANKQKKEADELAHKIIAKVKELHTGNRSITQAREMAAANLEVSVSTIMRASRRLQ